MKVSELREALIGISAVLITPFEESSLEIDEPGLRRVARFLDESDIDVIVPCGGAGEYYSLTPAERLFIVQTVLDEVKHKPVVVGVGQDNESAVESARHAQEHGAAGVMVHQPLAGGLTADGLREYYRAIAESIDIGLIAYAKSPIFDGQLLSRLASEANVAGVKYSIDNPKLFASTVDDAGDGPPITWICGTAESSAPFFWPAGAVGFTSGIANFAPEVSASLRDALISNRPEWRSIWSSVLPIELLRNRRQGANGVPVLKSGAKIRGLCNPAVRPPLSQMNDEDESDLRSQLESLGITSTAVT